MRGDIWIEWATHLEAAAGGAEVEDGIELPPALECAWSACSIVLTFASVSASCTTRHDTTRG